MTAQTTIPSTTHPGYARLLPQRLTHDFQAARSDPNALSLADEIALLRTFLGHYLSSFRDDQPITADDLERVGRHVEKISRLVARQARILTDDPKRVIREERIAWTEKVLGIARKVISDFLPPPEQPGADRRLTELLVEHDLLDNEPDNRSLLDGSPSLARTASSFERYREGAGG